jgi:ABC-2 type transport system permease protein
VLGNVFLKSLRDQRRALTGWSIGVIALLGLMFAVWPTFHAMPDLKQFMANYPEQFLRAFNVTDISTASGYVNAELFSIIVPGLFIFFGISRGARMIAGDEESGTLETVLVTPVSPARLLMQNAAALAASVVLLGVALLVGSAAFSAVFGLDVAFLDYAVASLGMVFIGLEHGFIALAVGAATGRRTLATAVAATVAVMGYVLFLLGQLVDSVRSWQPISPFHQALHAGPVGGELPGSYWWMVGVAVVAIAVALPLFDRRDMISR